MCDQLIFINLVCIRSNVNLEVSLRRTLKSAVEELNTHICIYHINLILVCKIKIQKMQPRSASAEEICISLFFTLGVLPLITSDQTYYIYQH